MFWYSHIGNYFWTHYFYRVLGARYTFVAWRLNDVSGSRVCGGVALVAPAGLP